MYAITWKVSKAGGWPDRSGSAGEFAGYIMESGVEEIFLSYKSSGKVKGVGQWAKSGDEVTSCMVFDNEESGEAYLNEIATLSWSDGTATVIDKHEVSSIGDLQNGSSITTY